ncbi:hypothetical protein EHS25_002596 [Saitozyma podzolica]|uniref:Membrane fraction protein n=1 Tax=Saitozyma podzolica TaxID=1890683 RepID=A0A427YDA5_9TREE|nr:hypothetical protein EHS25_002596 [Saitozyma podzolica]
MSSCACGTPGTCCKSSSSRPSSAVPLPRSHSRRDRPAHSASVWTIEQPPPTRDEQLESILADPQPLAHKCGADGRSDRPCCRDLKGEDERNLISPEIVRDIGSGGRGCSDGEARRGEEAWGSSTTSRGPLLGGRKMTSFNASAVSWMGSPSGVFATRRPSLIIGLSDGLTVPFALTAGLSSLGSSRLVVTGGLAELCAGAISMGLGGYLASQAELDHFHYLRKQTQARVLRSCAGEMEREVHSILGPLGVKEALSRLVADDLRSVEDDLFDRPHGTTQGSEGVVEAGAVAGSSSTKKSWWPSWSNKTGAIALGDDEEGGQPKGNEEMGLTAFLLKFGEGMEEVPRSRLYISALTIGLSYFIGGLIPLVPYMADVTAETGLIISSAVTVVVLFIFGGFKTYFTGAEGGWGGYLYGATSTMVVGGLAAGAAYGLVKALGVQE